jgi:hypothetical protein
MLTSCHRLANDSTIGYTDSDSSSVKRLSTEHSVSRPCGHDTAPTGSPERTRTPCLRGHDTALSRMMRALRAADERPRPSARPARAAQLLSMFLLDPGGVSNRTTIVSSTPLPRAPRARRLLVGRGGMRSATQFLSDINNRYNVQCTIMVT